MQVLSRCPLEVASILWLPRPGAYTLTVVAKATFRIEPEVSQLAEVQDPVNEADSYWDHDEAKSLDSATDLVPRKRHPEVLLVGHAYAPKGASVGALVARLTVCEIDKPIEITGDRHFKLDGTLSHPARFTKMPLRWERAAGGPETSNPVGVPMGEEARPDGWGRVPLPNLVPSGRIVTSREDIVAPACFAPIAPAWPARVARLHRHAATFSAGGWYARPIPPDLDMAYFNAAPQDQLVRELLGTERFTLENLHPHYPLLTTRLANVAPRATVDWGGGSSYDLPLTCDTLLIDTDRGVATVTFRGQLPLDFPERQGWVIITSDAAPARELPAWMHSVKDVHETTAPDAEAEPPAALPFDDDAAATGAFPLLGETGGTVSLSSGDAASTAALPFIEARSKAAHLPFEAAPGGKAAHLPFEAAAGGKAAHLPFEAAAGGKAAHLPFEAAAGGKAAHLPFEAAPAGKAAHLPFAEGAREGAGDDDLDEEETFASVRGDAPFPLGPSGRSRAAAAPSDAPVAAPSGAPVAARSDAPVAAPLPMVPPKVPQGPRLGAFRLAAKSDAPPPTAPKEIEDAPTGETGRVAAASERASDSGLPFTKAQPGKVQSGTAPPGKIAPMKPGVPPPPPSSSGRSQAPTFGFRRQNTLSSVGPLPTAGIPFAPREDEAAPPRAPAEATPESGRSFTRAQTLPTPGLYPAPAMPFGPPATPPGAPSSAATPFGPPAGAHGASSAAETLPGPMSFASLLAGPPLATTPFGSSASATPPPVATSFASAIGATAMITPMTVLGTPQGMTIGEMAPGARGSSPGMTIGEMVAQSRLPIEAPRGPIEAPPRGPLEATRGESEEPGAFEPESTQDGAPREGPVAPVEPPRLGPLATPEMVASDLGIALNEAPANEDKPPADAAVPAQPPAAPAPAEPPPLPLEKYPLERCARIAASIARSRDKKDEILEAHKLDEAKWEPLRTHWLDEIKKETERGKTEKLRAYDGAFVAQLEDERGPIAVEEYARIVISAERGTTNATLTDLKLPEGSMLRIQRVWMAKMGKDPDLRRLVGSAVEAASES